MKKIIDPIFGDIYYQSISTSEVSKKADSLLDRVCPLPFTKIMVLSDGEVTVCCPNWLPANIGNVLKDDILNIWSGEKANIIRNTILDGSYKYCDKNVCHYLHYSHKLPLKGTFDTIFRPYPEEVLLAVDRTCNLHCPACRPEKAILDIAETDETTKILTSVLRSLFNEPHNHPIDMTFDGRGDVFGSPIWRKLLGTEKCFTNPELWPNLKFSILTNGVLMTEKIQKKYFQLMSRVRLFQISVDAGNEESYNKVRLGGHWQTLLKNMNYLYESKLQYFTNPLASGYCQWGWVVVVQEDNFESIPELIQLAYKYPKNLPTIHLHPILQGHLTDSEYRKKAVWLESSSRHSFVKKVTDLPEVANYPRLYKPF